MERFCLPAQISRYTSFIYGCWLHPNAPSLQQQDKKKKLKKNIDYGKLTEKPAFNVKEQEFNRKGKRVCLTDNGRGRVRLNDFDSTVTC